MATDKRKYKNWRDRLTVTTVLIIQLVLPHSYNLRSFFFLSLPWSTKDEIRFSFSLFVPHFSNGRFRPLLESG